MAGTSSQDSYTLEQAEDDIGLLRQQVDRLEEIISQFSGAVIPNLPSQGFSQYEAGGHQKYISSADSGVYNTGRLTLSVTSDQSITSTTPITITGLSGGVAAATYGVFGIFRYTQGSAGVTQDLGFTGGGTWGAYSRISLIAIPNTGFTASTPYVGELGAAGTVVLPAFAATDAITVFICGVIAFGSAGTFALTGAEVTSGDSWTVKAGTTLHLLPVT
jgi:hypothetical protein